MVLISSVLGLCVMFALVGAVAPQTVYAAPSEQGLEHGGGHGGGDNPGGGKGQGKDKDKDRGPSVPAVPMAAAVLIGLGAIGAGSLMIKKRKKQE